MIAGTPASACGGNESRLTRAAASHGNPFRHAHELVGKAVAQAIAMQTPLDQLDLASIDPAYEPGREGCFLAGNRPRCADESWCAVHCQRHSGDCPLEDHLIRSFLNIVRKMVRKK